MATYQGKEVPLNKPFRLPKGSSKKFAVYVKDGDKVKRVTFGDPNMEIRRDDPEARANFRARHSCDTATDKTSARYWSCALWSDRSVSDITKAEAEMPYDRLPARLRTLIPSEDGQEMLRNIVNSQLDAGKSESVAFASAWAALERAGYEKEGDKWVKKGTPTASAVHVPSTEWDDDEESRKAAEGLRESSTSSIIRADMDEENITKTVEVIKADEVQRLVWGWASVSTENGALVTDRQGDMIEPVEMVKMANAFMEDVRTAKSMHEGGQIGQVIHSLPLTKELGAALGLESNREGWIVAMKIYDDAVWESVRVGTFGGFSIGGRAQSEEVE
jgi:cation transport regulator ChaB